jgi:hypothetical protein
VRKGRKSRLAQVERDCAGIGSATTEQPGQQWNDEQRTALDIHGKSPPSCFFFSIIVSPNKHNIAHLGESWMNLKLNSESKAAPGKAAFKRAE